MRALDGLSLALREGEFLALTGPSGCGKSSLMKHIIGLYRPMQGDILVDGRSIVKAGAREKAELQRRLGVTTGASQQRTISSSIFRSGSEVSFFLDNIIFVPLVNIQLTKRLVTKLCFAFFFTAP